MTNDTRYRILDAALFAVVGLIIAALVRFVFFGAC